MHQLVIYPNPLKNQTRFIIRGSLCNSGNRVRIKIFTLANRKIRETQWNSLPSGIFDLTMDAKDDKGSVLASGLYYVLIETYSGERKVLKLAIIH
jgi:flagellar hook assembly protein FlgD